MLLDAYAVVALLVGEPAGDVVRALVDDPAVHVRLTSLHAAEVVDRLARGWDAPPEQVAADVVQLGLDVTPVDDQLALLAGALRARVYDRSRAPLSLADCVAAAEALRCALPLVTADPHLLDLLAREGGTFVALPASDGTRHDPAFRLEGAPPVTHTTPTVGE